jgi:hypothetical protein
MSRLAGFDFETLRAARERIGGRASKAPLMGLRPPGVVEPLALSTRGVFDLGEVDVFSNWSCQTGLFLKCEDHHISGSFEPRGALNRLLSLPRDVVRRGVVTASDDNHGVAVAYAGRPLGRPKTVYVPGDGGRWHDLLDGCWPRGVEGPEKVCDPGLAAGYIGTSPPDSHHLYYGSRPMTLKMPLMAAIYLCTLGLVAGCTVNAQARVPEPNVLTAKKIGGTFRIDVSSVPQTEVCSEQGGLKDFCVTKFRAAIGGGLEKVLSSFLDRSRPGPAYDATFKLVEFSHSVTSVAKDSGSVKVTMRWQFVLRDSNGNAVVQLAETTDGPEQLAHVGSADKAVLALLNAVMEKIGGALNEHASAFAPPTPTPTPTPTEPAGTLRAPYPSRRKAGQQRSESRGAAVDGSSARRGYVWRNFGGECDEVSVFCRSFRFRRHCGHRVRDFLQRRHRPNDGPRPRPAAAGVERTRKWRQHRQRCQRRWGRPGVRVCAPGNFERRRQSDDRRRRRGELADSLRLCSRHASRRQAGRRAGGNHAPLGHLRNQWC